MAMMELKAYQSAALRQPVDNGRPAELGDSRSGTGGRVLPGVSGDAAGGRDRDGARAFSGAVEKTLDGRRADLYVPGSLRFALPGRRGGGRVGRCRRAGRDAMPTLDFKGKQHIYAHHLTVPYRSLVPDPKRSVKAKGADGNLIIHGDNLEALKALIPRYAGRVKCVYIDPPYNTGHEGWSYNDKVNSPLMQEWLKRNGQVDREDMERHDKWLCMMWPRLQLLKELLADDGTIFISIDDNELHHLRMTMDEIFGEENFVACISWDPKSHTHRP